MQQKILTIDAASDYIDSSIDFFSFYKAYLLMRCW